MSEIGKKLKTVLEGYARFLRDLDLAPQYQPQLVRSVQQFMLFGEDHHNYTFERALDLFLPPLGERIDTKAWQIQQAADAVPIYHYQ